MGKVWEFKDIPMGMDANMPRDRMLFVSEKGIYEMTGLGLPEKISEAVPTEAEMEAALSKAAEAAQAMAMNGTSRRATTDSLAELNRISQSLAQKATENIINGGSTIWEPFMYQPSQAYPTDGWMNAAQNRGLRQDSVDDLILARTTAETLGWVPTQMPPPPPPPPKQAASAEPKPLSKNGGRFVMLEDPE